MTTEISKSESKKNNWIAPFALIVGIVALVLSGFTYFISRQNQTASQLQALETSVMSVSQDSEGRALALQKQIAQLKTNLPLSSQKILAEVSFLTMVANTQLTVNYDINATLRTLKVAQALIASSNDAHFIGVSTAIQSDSEALQKAPAFNQSQLFSDISAVIQKIQALSTLPQTPTVIVNTTVRVEDATKPWYQKLLGVLSQLKDLVIIRHVNENNPPLVAPNMELNLKQNIITQLTMAQWALLHHNSTIYQSALQNVNEWTTRYFALTTERDGVSATLAQLMSVNIKPVLPALTNTLAALSQVNLLPSDSVKVPDVAPSAVAPAIVNSVPAKSTEKTPATLPEKPSNSNPTSVET
ncbi:MAG: uroporphyrinogen-III C-methyltransferase [Coxiellaceae bacterium]|nr:uroporphyrinogen-III C-methyltransferase [Coxiellaceae bacterium]